MTPSLCRINRALSSRQTLQASYDVARLAIERGIPGDFVECGVFAGAQCAAMALAIYEHEGQISGTTSEWSQRGTRRVHLFDSFAGVPEPGQYDQDWVKGGHKPGTSAALLEDVKANMLEWGIPDELLVYHPGLFDDIMPREFARSFNPLLNESTNTGNRIAVLRLDADLYESTRTALYWLYPMLSPGGWCIVDDYNLDGCRKAVDEYFYPEHAAPIYFQKR